MLTLFTVPKPFKGHIATIQRNAIQSWLQLRPVCEIILLGDDEGTAETAHEFGVRHIPDVACNQQGTPLVNSLFRLAQDAAGHPLLAYVNTDIILLNDFIAAVQRVSLDRFLMVGRRWDIDLSQSWDFSCQDWEAQLRAYLLEYGVQHGPTGIDYFVFSANLWDSIPPFAIGRTAWDNWLIYQARVHSAVVVDATQAITAIHQNHDYAHISGGHQGAWKGLEAQLNLRLAGGWSHIFTLQDATHILTQAGLKRAFDYRHLQRSLKTLPVFYPQLRLPFRILSKTVKIFSSPLDSESSEI